MFSNLNHVPIHNLIYCSCTCYKWLQKYLFFFVMKIITFFVSPTSMLLPSNSKFGIQDNSIKLCCNWTLADIIRLASSFTTLHVSLLDVWFNLLAHLLLNGSRMRTSIEWGFCFFLLLVFGPGVLVTGTPLVINFLLRFSLLFSYLENCLFDGRWNLL